VTIDADLGELLQQARAGDRAALDRLFLAIYPELQSIARRRLRALPRITMLDTVGLVGETYLRLAQAGRLAANDRPHFLRYAARVMRSVIVDHVRRRTAERRGGKLRRTELTTERDEVSAGPSDEILRVHAALEELASSEPRAVEVAEMRYFSGMQEIEIAKALGVTERTVRRDWLKAKVLLAEALDLPA
jgi:RNA polymerase sigma factor (TIGR02999 family)